MTYPNTRNSKNDLDKTTGEKQHLNIVRVEGGDKRHKKFSNSVMGKILFSWSKENSLLRRELRNLNGNSIGTYQQCVSILPSNFKSS